MTSERMAQLLEDAILTQDLCDAFLEEIEAERLPQFFGCNHEQHIHQCMNAMQVRNDLFIQRRGYDSALLEHYLLGAKHPHDVNYSLDQWDQID